MHIESYKIWLDLFERLKRDEANCMTAWETVGASCERSGVRGAREGAVETTDIRLRKTEEEVRVEVKKGVDGTREVEISQAGPDDCLTSAFT